VSGASSADEDQELSVIGAGALAAPLQGTNGAWIFPRGLVEQTFQTGGLLLDAPTYKIDAGRREGPGEVEYHERVTDVMHVLEGSATVITGGEMVDPREVGPGELRASGVVDGTRHEVAEGDVLAIPGGVPHQFVEVSDPFLYF